MSAQTSRWCWLKRLFFASLFLLVVLLALAYYKLSPLAESSIRKVIDSGNFASKEFTVTSVGPTETVLRDIDVAGRGWRLESPELTATYTWSDIQSSRLSEIVVTRGVLTLDIDTLNQPPEQPNKIEDIGSAPPQPSKGEPSALPFDQLLAQEITIVLKKGDAKQTLHGVTSITGHRWSFDLAERRHRLRGSASLSDGHKLGRVTVHSSNGDVPSWLTFFDIDASMVGELELGQSDLKVFRSDRDSPWEFEAEVTGIKVTHDAWSAEVDTLAVAGDVKTLSGRGQLNDLVVTYDEETLRMNGRHQLKIDGAEHLTVRTGIRPHILTLKDHFAAPVFMTVSMDAGKWEADLESVPSDDAGGLDTHLFGRLIDPFKLKINAGRDGKIVFSLPMLRTGSVSLEDISGELSTDDLSVKASYKIYYGQGEIYGPVPITLNGTPHEESWNLHLQAETVADKPWQAYWKGLGFSLHGRAEASWQTNSTEIRLVSQLDSAEVRRNESAVVLDQVTVDGTHNLSMQALDLGLAGRSRGREFTGALTSSLDESGRRFDYAISKLSLPENTLLGAFASALKEMPMAAFLDGAGEVEVPYDGEPEHRLSLKLARGVYRHPERKLAGQGIAGTFAIESFDPFVTVDDQRAIFGRWRMGDLELSDGQFLYKLGPRGAVLIKEAEAKGIGGRLTMKALSSHPGQPDFESVVTFDKIDLSKLADLIPGFKGKVGGRVSGQVHLRFRDGVLSLPQGSLALDASSPAFLHLNAKEALGAQLSEIAQDPTALEIVESALKDLVVHELEIGFFDPDAKESVARIRLKGRSREEVPIPNTQGKGKASAPIHLNINVDDPSELVRRLLNFGLRKQLNTRLKPGG
ncbi:YdbH domain-containing protein [Verrucomicrobiales bacterium]|nr:YdbH domain-containing protein [Verrucomicrobiales bacterium]